MAAKTPRKYSDEEVALAREQEEGDQMMERITMLEKRCLGLRIELNRANKRVEDLTQKGSGEVE